jgi:alkanesulfonate monooxygenase SsuD/methylene tetrahydromethanopterin reductase-like flavin-dependent oxidoreductase (luciferase family)
VKFGLFYEHPLPRPWSEDSEYELIQNALEQCELADRLGIDFVWEVEHHFLEEYSHSSAPEVFLAAVAGRTQRIRLGHGIVQTPPGFNHPARVAERIAMLDLVSNGRVEFGTGESSSEAELGGFMLDPEHKRAMWEEGTRVALRCLTEEPFTGHSGTCVTMPPRNVVPKPRQKPHPPVWVACSRRDTIHLAATKGMGALAFAFINPEEAAFWVQDYYKTLAEECVPIGDAVNANLACVTTFMCDRDEDVALARGLEGANFFGYSLAHYYVFGKHAPARTNVWEEFVAQRKEKGYAPEAVEAALAHGDRLGAKVVQDGAGGGFFGIRGAIGTPEQVRDYLRRYEEFGVDQIIFCSQAGRNRHEHIMESLELFAKEVMPEFVERDEAHQQAKAKRLEGVIERAMARKPASDHPPLPVDDYAFPAIPRAMAERAGSDDFLRWLDHFAAESAVGGGEELHRMEDLIG